MTKLSRRQRNNKASQARKARALRHVKLAQIKPDPVFAKPEPENSAK